MPRGGLDDWSLRGLGVSSIVRRGLSGGSKVPPVGGSVERLWRGAYRTFSDWLDTVNGMPAGRARARHASGLHGVPGLRTYGRAIGAAAGVLLVAAWIALLWGRVDNRATQLPSPPTESEVEPVQSIIAPTEPIERPPATGKNIALARDNIRYCLFQQVRVEALGPLTAAFDLTIFDALVSDWNARCGLAVYPPAEKAAIDAELLGRRAIIETEGREFASRWRRRMSARVGSMPTGAVVSPVSATVATGNGAQPPFSEMPPEMSTVPAVVTAQLFLNDAAALAPSKPPSLMLLHPYVAARVQRRLNELGYTVVPADGAWGPMSRTALKRFKQANGLLWDDALDAETVARLFSMAAVSASGVDAGQPDNGALAFETAYPPPSGATMNPLNRLDAGAIQHRLAMLGYYVGDTGPWGATSRAALREFKVMNHLQNNDEWDAVTEAALNSDGPASVSGTFVARWPKRPVVCDAGLPAGNDVIPRTGGVPLEDSRATGDLKSLCRAVFVTDAPATASARALPLSVSAASAAGNGATGGRSVETAAGSQNAASRVAPRPAVPMPVPRRPMPSD